VNLKERLQDRNLKWNWDEIAGFIIQHPEMINELIDFSFHGEKIEKQNAAAVIGKICDQNKAFLTPYLETLFHHLETNPIDAVKRSTIRILQFTDIPESIEGELFDLALSYITSLDELIAVKAFAMTVARRICEKYPELSNELIPIVETIQKEKISSGMTNRAQHELKKLLKIQDNITQ
jgi:hypothetical protein